MEYIFEIGSSYFPPSMQTLTYSTFFLHIIIFKRYILLRWFGDVHIESSLDDDAINSKDQQKKRREGDHADTSTENSANDSTYYADNESNYIAFSVQ